MSPHLQQVLADALKLDPTERAELMEQILASFDPTGRKRFDEFWAAEAEERIDAYERGEICSTPAGVV